MTPTSQQIQLIERKKNVLQDVAPPSKLSGKEIVYKYIVFLPLFIVSVSISLTVAYINLRYKVPIYSSSISLLIKDDKSSRGGGEDLILENLTTYKKKTNLANEIEMIKSNSMLCRVVRILNLNWQYFNEGNIKRVELYGNTSIHANWVELKDSSASASLILVRKKESIYIEFGTNRYKIVFNGDIVEFPFGKMRVFFDPSEIAKDNKYIINYQPTSSAAGGIAGGLQIRQLSRETSILILNISLEVPQKGRDILNTLVNVYNDVNVEDKNKIVDNTIRFIDQQLNVLTDTLKGMESELQSFKIQSGYIGLDVQGKSHFEKSEGFKEKIIGNDFKQQMINEIKEYVSVPQKKYDIVVTPFELVDPSLSTLIGQYNSLQLSRAVLLKTTTQENPLLKQAEANLEKLRINILEALSNQSKNITHFNKTFDDMSQIELDKLKKIPERERQYLDLIRKESIKEKEYFFRHSDF